MSPEDYNQFLSKWCRYKNGSLVPHRYLPEHVVMQLWDLLSQALTHGKANRRDRNVAGGLQVVPEQLVQVQDRFPGSAWIPKHVVIQLWDLLSLVLVILSAHAKRFSVSSICDF